MGVATAISWYRDVPDDGRRHHAEQLRWPCRSPFELAAARWAKPTPCLLACRVQGINIQSLTINYRKCLIHALRAKFWCLILCDPSTCQQGVGFAHPAPQARKGFEMATSAARHGPSAIRHAPAPRYRGRYTYPRCPLPSSASPPRPRHGKSRFIFIRAFVLSQCLHLVSIVCDVSVGRENMLKCIERECNLARPKVDWRMHEYYVELKKGIREELYP